MPAITSKDGTQILRGLGQGTIAVFDGLRALAGRSRLSRLNQRQY